MLLLPPRFPVFILLLDNSIILISDPHSSTRTFTLSIGDAATATEHGALRHLKGPPGGHPNKDNHTPDNGCPKQTFPATGTECPNGGAFSTDTCIACCECECDDETGSVEAKAKCEFEGEEDTAPEDLSTCDTYDMFDYDGVDGDCDSTCATACTAPERK